MKTIVIFSLCIVFGLSSLFAQEAGKIRAGAEIGCLFPHESGFGFLGAVELKYNLQNNMNVGIKPEVTNFWKHKDYRGNIYSFSITYDYYFHSTGKRTSPFVGAGLGYYFCDARGPYSSDVDPQIIEIKKIVLYL